MKDTRVKKGLVITIIFLFISITYAPSINFNVVKASSDNEMVEVTSEACGINGFGDKTIKLTKQKYQNLKQYLVDFRERLNQTTTREEAVPIFNDAVVELDKYGLLPKGMSVEQAQKLVSGGYQNSRLLNFIEKRFSKNLEILNNSNFFCLTAGRTTYTMIIPHVGMTLNRILVSAYNIEYMLETKFPLVDWKILHYFCGWLEFILFINIAMPIVSEYIPLTYSNGIALGWRSVDWWTGVESYVPASGNIITFGVLGKKIWEGKMYGQIQPYPELVLAYIGATGFTGLKINPTDDLFNYYYLGFTRYIHIGNEVPEFFGIWDW